MYDYDFIFADLFLMEDLISKLMASVIVQTPRPLHKGGRRDFSRIAVMGEGGGWF